MTPSLSQYAGQYVAFIEEEVVVSAKTSLEAFQKAKKISSSKMITLEYIPTQKEIFTFL